MVITKASKPFILGSSPRFPATWIGSLDGLKRYPVTVEITGSNPVQSAKYNLL